MSKIYDPEFLGLQVSKMMGEEAIVFCPYHSDSNPSAEFSLTKGLFYCFGCQERKTAVQLAEELGGELVELAEIPGVDLGLGFEKGEKLWFDILKNPLATDSEYLAKRMVSQNQIWKHDIRENKDGVIFPIRDKMYNAIGAQSRHYKRKPKYLFHGKRFPIWPIENALQPGPMFVVEGVFGVLRAERIVNQATVAIMGAGAVKNASGFLNGLGSTVRPMAIMDNDYAGLLAAGKFVLMGVPAILTPFENDPDEWSFEQWEYIGQHYESNLTWEVEDVIERSKDPLKMRSTLVKFWRKL